MGCHGLIARLQIVALTMFFVSGCGGGGKPVAAPESATTSSVAQGTGASGGQPPEGASAASPKVRLIDPGAAPRQKLRYRFSVGSSQWIQMDMKMAMGFALVGAKSHPVTMPTVRTSMRIDPKNVDSEGNLSYEFEVTKQEVLTDAPLAAPLRENLEKTMSRLVGMRGRGVISSRGVTKESKITMPPDVPQDVAEAVENLQSSMRNLSAQLPEEEVGQGAKWVVDLAIITPAIHFTQTITHVLRELRPNTFSTEFSFVQTAPRQEMPSKRNPDAKVELVNFESNGGGNSQVPLDALVPSASIKLFTIMHLLITQPDAADVKMVTTVNMDMVIQRASPAR